MGGGEELENLLEELMEIEEETDQKVEEEAVTKKMSLRKIEQRLWRCEKGRWRA